MLPRDAAIVTVVVDSYWLLLHGFATSVRFFFPAAPLFVLVPCKQRSEIADDIATFRLKGPTVQVISFEPDETLPLDAATQGCAAKMRVWELLPPTVKSILFIDVDAVVVGPFWPEFMKIYRPGTLALARDTYVGFKERMGSDFECLGKDWMPHFDRHGRRFYCNTGLFYVHRHHKPLFDQVLQDWRVFAAHFASSPPIWDQGLFNFQLDIGEPFGWDNVTVLPERFNALKEYDLVLDLDLGGLVLDGDPVQVVHLNGGTIAQKFARRARVMTVVTC